MPYYRNYISLGLEKISTAREFYLISLDGGRFKFCATSQGCSEMEEDPWTRVKAYWPILREQLNFRNQAILFNGVEEEDGREIDRVIRSAPLTTDDLKCAFGFDPTIMQQYAFHRYFNRESIYVHAIELLIESLCLGDEYQDRNHYIRSVLRRLSESQSNRDRIKRTIDATVNVIALSQLLISMDIATTRHAAGALVDLAIRIENQIAIRDARVIPLLTALLESHDRVTKRFVVRALANLAMHDENQLAIRHAQLIPLLTALLSSSDWETAGCATRALANLAFHDENRIDIREAQAIAPLTVLLTSPYMSTQDAAAHAFANLAINDENRIAIRQAQAISPLTALLTSWDMDTKQHAVRAFAMLSINLENQIAIRDAQAIPPLIALLTSPDRETKCSAVFALANLNEAVNERSLKSSNRDGETMAEALLSVKEKLQSYGDLGNAIITEITHLQHKGDEGQEKLSTIISALNELSSEVSDELGLSEVLNDKDDPLYVSLFSLPLGDDVFLDTIREHLARDSIRNPNQPIGIGFRI
jgi:Arc/MetJ-type ribon-helix-helix transcriptional regulator